jgi:hypothetical protein
MKRHLIGILVLLSAFVLWTGAYTTVPRLINYQGILTDTEGSPITGTHDLTFKIYDDSLATIPYWSELHASVDVDEGLFNVILGRYTVIPDTLFASGERWMGITVDVDPELSPKMRITSVPWALRAAVADTALAVADVPSHTHDDRYYTETELNTNDGTVNEPDDPVDWTKLKSVPGGFADGVDDVGGGGDGHSLDAADGSPADVVYVDNDGRVEIGNATTASGDLSIAMGDQTTASGNRSTAMGEATTASGYRSTAMGFGTEAEAMVSTAVGSFNIGGGDPNAWIDTDPIFEIGIGPSSGSRANAVTVLKNGDVGIGVTAPVFGLDVADTIQTTGFKMPTGASNGYVLTSNADGVGSWQSVSTGADTDWTISGDDMYSAVPGKVGIGVSSPRAKLHVARDDTVLFGDDTEGAGRKLMWLPTKGAFRAGEAGPTGWNAASIGARSFATGYRTEATGAYSFAAGYSSEAAHDFATAMGWYAIASGNMSTAIGTGATAESYKSVAIGGYNIGGGDPTNWIDTDPLFEIGKGETSGAADNAVTVLKNGNVGIGTAAPATALHVAEDDTVLFGASTEGAGSKLIWLPETSAFRAGYIAGGQWNPDSIGVNSFACGRNSNAAGDCSVAMGWGSIASGDFSTALGYKAEASGEFSVALGIQTDAEGESATAFGEFSRAQRAHSTAMGYGAWAAADYSTAMGHNTLANGTEATAMGYYSAASGLRSTAMGHSGASGDYSTSMGERTYADARSSVAIGRHNIGGGSQDSWVETDPIFEIGIGNFGYYRANAMTVLKNGYVGIGTHTPSNLLQLTSDEDIRTLDVTNTSSLSVSQTVNFERTMDPGSANDIVQIEVPTTAPDDFQFIECERGSDVEFRVEGNGNLYADGTLNAPADFAEMIEVSSGAKSAEAGDVMVIDPGNPRAIVKASAARSTLVAGVYSTKPGFLGSEREWDKPAAAGEEEGGTYTLEEMANEFNEIPMAVVGIVPCKVSAENGAIQPGDLLVTSTTPGHAMRDDEPKIGTVVGKALGSLTSGTGVIKVLVTLH